MNNERANIAVAESMGWKWYRRPAKGPWAKTPYRALYHPDIYDPVARAVPMEPADMTERECNSAFIMREGCIPDYGADLNAMHEVERSLTEERRDVYIQMLCKAIGKFAFSDRFWVLIHATAFQRREAYLRTIGKWEEKE